MILDKRTFRLARGGSRTALASGEYASDLALPIALGEFRFGVLRSRYRAAYEERLRLIEDDFPPLPLTGITAMHYAAIRQEVAKKGRPIPWHDLWIAAQARQHRLPVLSRDKHFDVVPGLARVGW